MSIVLDAPLEMLPPATRVELERFTVTEGMIEAEFSYRDAVGNAVRINTLRLTGQDYLDMADAVIMAGVVGERYFAVLKRSLKNKIKTAMSLQGTVT